MTSPALLAETEPAAVAAGEAERARESALDPALSAADVIPARREMEARAFRQERLQTAVVRLKARLREIKGLEEDHRRRVIYEKTKAE